MSTDIQIKAEPKAVNVIGLVASLAFFIGSTLFLPQFSRFATTGVYLFMLGSSLMLFYSVRGKLLG